MRQKNKGMKKTGVLGFMILCLLSGCVQQSAESTEATTDVAVNRKVTESDLHYSGGWVLFTMYGRLLSGCSSGYVDLCK